MKRTPRFEEEVIAEIDKIMKRPPKPEVITCNCCYKYFRSKDKYKYNYCVKCEEHYLNRGALGCPMILMEVGGVSLSRMHTDPTHGSNDHLFKSRKYRDKRRRHDDIPIESPDDLPDEDDLGIRVFIERDE